MAISFRTTGLAAILLLLVTSYRTLAAPSVESFVGDSDHFNSGSVIVASESSQTCAPGTELRDLCERCTKATRSVLAYPFCCKRRNSVHKWCAKFLSFTLQED